MHDIETARWKNIWFVFASAPFLAFALLIGLFAEPRPGEPSPWWALAVMGPFAVLWSGLAWWGLSSEHGRLLAAWREGRAQKAEGAVERFESGLRGKGIEEKFQVAGVWFRYRSNVLSAAFNKTAKHGGPMREGLRVRIWYVADPHAAKQAERLMRPDAFERRFLRMGAYIDQLAAEGGLTDNKIVRLEAATGSAP